MLSRAATIALCGALFLAGCEQRGKRLLDPKLASGDFCDQLVHVIRTGVNEGHKDGFEGFIGSRMDSSRFTSTLVLRGAEACWIETGSISSQRFACKLADGPQADQGQLRAAMHSFERQINSCLAEQNRFGYGTRSGPEPRYERGRQSGGDIRFDDKYHLDQDVKLEMRRVGEGYHLVMTISGG